ncbi:hypothetical protein E2C01_051455 [Portunus trituberculatus]|uniref:Uncharacterized protein n=1 Tax=Portunus trituberculatus TaxID=210409 RepID=A0A5B7GJ88_PORTR|nr:hypothetical protein [Portunus trituberculatus]
MTKKKGCVGLEWATRLDGPLSKRGKAGVAEIRSLPLTEQDRTTTIASREKVELLAGLFYA